MSDVPTLRDELNRKAIEALEWLMTDVRAGKLSDSQFATGVEAVWSCAAGLVDERVKDLIGEASAIACEKPPTERHFFWKKELMVVERTMQECGFLVSKPLRGWRHPVECASPREAREHMDALMARLHKEGWREL